MGTALVRPHPLSAQQFHLTIPEGATLADLARAAFPDLALHRYVVAFVGDRRVPFDQWEYVRPKAGAMVRLGLTCFEGGSGGGKQVLSIVAMIAIAYFAGPAAMSITGTTSATAGFGTYALAAGITMVGSLAVQAIFKPPGIEAGVPTTNPADAPTYSLTGQANSATPYGPMLRVYGRHRIYPRLAAVPFTVTEGPNQFLYMLLDCGYGPLVVEDIQIGDTPVLNYRDVLYRVHERWRAGDALEYYRNDTAYENFGLVLVKDLPEYRTTAPETSGIVLDFALPRGLVIFDDRGARLVHEVSFDVYVRPAGSGGPWEHARTYPVYVSRQSSTYVTIGAFIAGPFGHRNIAPGDTIITYPSGVGAAVNDIIYLASQEKVTIIAIGASGIPGRDALTVSPPVKNFYAPFSGVESPLMKQTGASGQIALQDSVPTTVYFSMTIDVPVGTWEVQTVRRSTASTTDRVFDELVWSSLRSVHDRPPVAVQTDHTLIELKIRASEQLSGSINNVNCIATSLLPVYSGTIPPEGVVHFDFLTGNLQPIYGASLATAAVARVNAIATRVNELGVLVTTPADAPRFDHDPVTLAPRGLLIEQGVSNQLLSSQDLRSAAEGNPVGAWGQFVDAEVEVFNVVGVVTSPSGGTTVSKLRCTTTAVAQRQTSQSRVLSDNTIYCASIYVMAGEVTFFRLYLSTKFPNYPYAIFNLSTGVMTSSGGTPGDLPIAAGIINAGGGWYRCWLAVDVKTGVANPAITCQMVNSLGQNYSGAVGDGLYLWGAQMEVGSAPTSYIQTFTGAVGRNNDLGAINAIGGFFNAAEGTIVSEWVVPHDRSASVFPGSAVFTDGTDNNRLGNFARSVDDTAHLFAIAGGVSQADVSLGAYAYGSIARQAFSYKANRFAASLNGAAVLSDNAGTVPVVNRLLLGRTGDGHNWLNGWLRRVTYYPFAATDAQLVAMAGPAAALAPEIWVEQATRSPAWAYADVLTGSGATRPLPISRLNLPALRHWADYCETIVPNGVDSLPEPRVLFDHVVDYATTTHQLLQSIAAAGRATPALRDGLHGVIIDEEQTAPVQLFTPHNSWSFSARRSYLTEPDALRIKFIDPENSWLDGEVAIYATGKDAATAATFEDLKLFGVTRYTQATRDGRYLKAQAMLRREEFTIQTDVENLICARGDLVAVAHDVLKVGGLSSRVVAVAGALITIADPFGSMPAGTYGVRLRLSDGTITAPIAATPTAPDKFTLALVPTPAPAVGDLVSWGVLSLETGDYLVKSIAPGDDFTAELSLVEVARGVYTADSGAIPAYKPPAGGRPVAGRGPEVVNLRVQQIDKTIGREPYCDLVLSWDVPPLGGYAHYQIGLIRDDGVTVAIDDTFSTRSMVATDLPLLDPTISGAARTFIVVGVDLIGRLSLPAQVTFTPTDPRHVPGDCAYLSSNAHDKTTTLTWLAPPLDPSRLGNGQIMFYEVRWVPQDAIVQWGSASRVTELIPWNVTTVTVPSRNGIYLVKALTASLMESVNHAVTVTAVEDLVIQDFWRSHHFEPAWAGSFDQVVVDGSNRLILAVKPDGTYPRRGIYYAAAHETFSEQLQCRISAQLTAEGANNTGFMVNWVPLAIAVPLASARRGVDWDAALWVNAEPDPFVMADWVPLAIASPLDATPPLDDPSASWRPMLHGEVIAANLRFAVVLEALHANVSPRVSAGGADIDFPERAEEHADIIVPIAGLDFVFSRPFVFAPSVALDLQDAAPGDYIDRGPVDQVGFPVTVRNSAGAAIAGTIDISALGVGRVI